MMTPGPGPAATAAATAAAQTPGRMAAAVGCYAALTTRFPSTISLFVPAAATVDLSHAGIANTAPDIQGRTCAPSAMRAASIATARMTALAEALLSNQEPDKRLVTVTLAYRALTTGLPEFDPALSAEACTTAFVAAGGAAALHERLHAMNKNWMQEARNGTTSLLDNTSRLPGLQAAIAELNSVQAAEIAAAACQDCFTGIHIPSVAHPVIAPVECVVAPPRK